MFNTATIADSLSPSEIAALEQAFRLEVAEYATPDREWIDTEIETLMGFVTGEYLWYSAWLFGIVVDDDLSYYVPSDHLVEVVLTDSSDLSEGEVEGLDEAAPEGS